MARTPFAAVTLLSSLFSTPLAFAQPPDFQGVWTNATMTPLQRPAEAHGAPYFTPEEARAWENGFFERARKNLGAAADLQADLNDTYIEKSFVDRLRTSLIVDPTNGLLPPLSKAASVRAAGRQARAYDNPEDGTLAERCLAFAGGTGSTLIPPMIPHGLVSYYQFVQTDDVLVIAAEWIHDTRIIRIGGTHDPSTVKKWMGDSIGHWEGQTLVVDTVNFRPDTRVLNSGEQLHTVERFTRTDASSLRYEVTVEDPDTWSTPWQAEVMFRSTEAPMFEFACHEGNRAIELFLRGARYQEAQQGEQPVAP